MKYNLHILPIPSLLHSTLAGTPSEMFRVEIFRIIKLSSNMECHPWFEVSDRRNIRFRNVQIKVLLVFEQGRPLQVSTSFDNFDQFGRVSASFDQFRPVLTSLDWFISLLIKSKIQYFITVADQCVSNRSKDLNNCTSYGLRSEKLSRMGSSHLVQVIKK